MSQLIAKLKLLKRELKVWNWSIFGDLNRSISATQDQIFVIQNRLASEGHSDDLLRLEMEAIADLDKLLSQQEVFLLEQSHVKWLKEGDRNSSFFHNVLKRHRSKKLLSHMKIGDVIVENVDQISSHLQDFYKNFFSAPNSVMPDYTIIHETIPKLVSGEDNLNLAKVLDYTKIC